MRPVPPTHVQAEPWSPPPAPSTPWLVGLVTFLAVVLGIVAGFEPILAVLGAGALLGGVLVLMRPDLAAPAVAFLLWANVPVVAMRNHGVPKFVASGYLLLLFVPIAKRLLIERRGFRVPGALPWALAYIAFSVLSAAFARDPERALEGAKEYGLEGVLVFVLIAFAAQGVETLRKVAWGIVGAGAFMGGIAALQQLTGNFDSNFGGFSLVDSGFEAGEVTQMRLAGPIGEKNRFGQIMLVAAGLGVGLARAETLHWLRLAAFGGAGLSVLGAALTFSRGTAVAAAALVGTMALFGMVKKRQLFGIGVAGMMLMLALPQYRARIATVFDVFALASPVSAEKPDNAILGRATEVIAAALVYVDHPVLGVGPSLFASYSMEYGNSLGLRRLRTEREAHMLFPHVAAEGGTLGLVSFSALLLFLMHRLWQLSRNAETERERELAAGFFLALTAHLLCGVFLHQAFVRYYWFIVGAAAAMSVRPLVGERGPRPLAPEPPAPLPSTGTVPTP